MMATIEYNLDIREENTAMQRALKSTELAISLWQITQLRYEIENRLEIFNGSDAEFQLMEEIFLSINMVMEKNGIDLDKLVE